MKRNKYLLPLLLASACLAVSCGPSGPEENRNHVVMSIGMRIASLDPVMAADTASQSVICAFYDTLLQYRYSRDGGYVLEPSMLKSMPEISADLKTYTCELRSDLYFADGPPFAGQDRAARRITSKDVVFSLLRLADPHVRSPGYWVIRGRIAGLEKFRTRAGALPEGDFRAYEEGVEGLEIVSDTVFRIHLAEPNPRFHYSLALPYCAVVSRTVVTYYGKDFARNPLGSGPFLLARWEPDYVMEMVRNPDFRHETYAQAPEERDRKTPLPFADRITCYLVKQPLSSWLMFLQGELDYYALDADHFESVVDAGGHLSETLTDRGISLLHAPQLETNYIGFNFADPLLASNRELRIAVTLAFDKKMRVAHSSGRFIPAYGVIPPGTPGELTKDEVPYPDRNLEEAKKHLAKAGYPDGIDPRTGRPLELTFDQTGSDTFYRQTAELFAEDLRGLGIVLKPEFNTKPRFFQKLNTGNVQLFRLSWTGDYPDAENFLQLFYGPNAGSCNRVSYRDSAYDAMYEEILSMPDSPARTEKYRKMARYLTEQCPWIFETHPSAFILTHRWLRHYIPHDFGFNRWKYLSSDSAERAAVRSRFTPIRMKDLR